MRGEVSSTVAVVSEFRLSSPLDVGGDCQGSLEPTAPPPIVPNAAFGHCVRRFYCGRVWVGWPAGTEVRDSFRSWGDPVTRSGLEEDQGICGARPGT